MPGYIAAAFAVGSQHIVTAQTVLIALGGALLAAFAATLLPALAILRAGADAEPEGLGRTLSLTRAMQTLRARRLRVRRDPRLRLRAHGPARTRHHGAWRSSASPPAS